MLNRLLDRNSTLWRELDIITGRWDDHTCSPDGESAVGTFMWHWTFDSLPSRLRSDVVSLKDAGCQSNVGHSV